MSSASDKDPQDNEPGWPVPLLGFQFEDRSTTFMVNIVVWLIYVLLSILVSSEASEPGHQTFWWGFGQGYFFPFGILFGIAGVYDNIQAGPGFVFGILVGLYAFKKSIQRVDI